MQSFTVGLATAVAVHLYSPHYYTVFHHGTVDCVDSLFNVFLLYSLSLWDLRMALAVTTVLSIIQYFIMLSTADCGRSPFNVFIITQHFTAAVRTAAAVSLMSSL